MSNTQDTVSSPTSLLVMEPVMETPLVEDLHRSKTGKTSDKWASYLSFYDKTFAPLQQLPLRLLEIGVQNGGSLETWSNYFSEAKLFVGCDIDPKCANLHYDDPRIRIVIGDVNDAPTYQNIIDISSGFDIIIDDGSHRSFDIINAFVNYFPLVSPGGIYIVEDAHTLYMNNYDGGILNELSGYAFFKRLVDVISFEFWRDQLNIQTYLKTFFTDDTTPTFILDGWIESIEFRNSIIAIRKASRAGHDKLGERLITGSSAQVNSLEGKAGPVKHF